MKWVGLIAAVLALMLACKSSPQQPRPLRPPPPVWQSVDGSPVIQNEFIRDDMICHNPRPAGFILGPISAIESRRNARFAHQACMAERGWILVPVEPQ
jgi:hypothetical protein